MSRICGIINPEWSRSETLSALDRLINPLRHSADFEIERQGLSQAALGRVYFKHHNFSTHLFVSPDSSVVCAFTGYLYDPDQLKSQTLTEGGGTASVASPAALLAFLFPRHRSKLLVNLSGSFVFALWEANSQTLTLGTDRYSMIPLYYREGHGHFAFSSEIKSLLALHPDRGINLHAVSELLALGSPQGDHTLYPSVRRLAPATLLTFRDGRLDSRQYWSFEEMRTEPDLNVNEYIEEAQRLLGQSVSRLVRQIDRPICFLSAGYDSRRILLELVRQGKPITAYTAPTVKHDCPYTCDVPVASALCAALGVSHVASDLPRPSLYGTLARHAQTLLDFETDTHAWILPLLARLPVNDGVNFDGLGGDVLYEFNWTYPEHVEHLDDPNLLAGIVHKEYPDLWDSYFGINAPAPSLTERHIETFRRLPKIADRITAFYLTNWTRRKTALFSQGLLSLKIDSVYPFLDYALVDHVLRLPPVIRRQSEVSKQMLLVSHPDIMRRIPTSHDEQLVETTDQAMSAFRTLLPPHYWLQTQSWIHRAAAIDIMRAGGVWGQLSQKAKVATLANLVPWPTSGVPHKITNSSWRLIQAGLYARQRHNAQSTSWAGTQLEASRAFVFGG